jgi:hypothetical protein
MPRFRRLRHYRDGVLYKSKSHYRSLFPVDSHVTTHQVGGSDELDITGLKIHNHIDTDVAVIATPGDFIQADLSVRGSFTITLEESSFENDGRVCVIQRVDDGQLGVLTVAKTGGDKIIGALCDLLVDSFDVYGKGDGMVFSWDNANSRVKLY